MMRQLIAYTIIITHIVNDVNIFEMKKEEINADPM